MAYERLVEIYYRYNIINMSTFSISKEPKTNKMVLFPFPETPENTHDQVFLSPQNFIFFCYIFSLTLKMRRGLQAMTDLTPPKKKLWKILHKRTKNIYLFYTELNFISFLSFF